MGVTTNNLTTSNLADTLIGNYQGSTRQIPVARLVAMVAALMGPTYSTRAALIADKDWPDGAIGYVRADPTTSYNGVYKKAGAVGSGSWSRIGDLPAGAVESALISDEVAARIAGDNALAENIGKIFASREAAVLAGQAAIPGIWGRIITIEGTSLVVRGTAHQADDPLFATWPYWGAVLRLDTASSLRNAGILTLTLTGGTGDAIEAELHPTMVSGGITNISVLSTVEYLPVATNTAANPTITIAGTTYAIRGPNGNAWPAGGFVVGRIYLLRRRATTMQVISGDATSVEMAAARSERIAAEIALGVATLESVTGSDTITATLPPALVAAGVNASNLRRIRFQAAGANTGAVTISVDGAAAASLRDATGEPLSAGALLPGRFYEAIRVGTVWRLANGEVTRADLTAPVNTAISGESALRISGEAALREEMRQRSVALAAAITAAGALTADLRTRLLSDGAHIRLWPGAAAEQTAGKLTAITAAGQLGLTFGATDSPNIDLLDDGIRINGGRLQWIGVTAPSYTGALILLDVTRNAAPTAGAGNIVSLDLEPGTQLHLRYNVTGLQVLAPDGSVVAFAPIGGYGVRQKVAVLCDFQGRSITLISADGVAQTVALSGSPAPLNLNQIRFGAASLVTIHDAVVMLTESGVPDLDLWYKVFTSTPAVSAPALITEVSVCDGQSNALANDNSLAARQHLAV